MKKESVLSVVKGFTAVKTQSIVQRHANRKHGESEMNLHPTSEEIQMHSYDFLDVVNRARQLHGESKVSNTHFLARVMDECDFGDDKIFTIPNAQNKKRMKCVFLNYDEMMLVGMRESKAVRKSVLAKIKELAKPVVQLPDFTNPAEAARAWADEVEKKQFAEQQLALAAPKVEFVDKFVETGTTKTFRETAKILGYPERKMIALLIEQKVLYRQSGSLLPYQKYHAQELFEVKTGEANGHAYTQTRVTAKGVQWIAERYTSDLG